MSVTRGDPPGLRFRPEMATKAAIEIGKASRRSSIRKHSDSMDR